MKTTTGKGRPRTWPSRHNLQQLKRGLPLRHRQHITAAQ